MEFRRGSHRDERRRRVLIEEPEAGQSSGFAQPAVQRRQTDSSSGEPVPRYSDAALRSPQPRLIDLIPTRCWTNLVLAALVLSCAVGIEVLYGYVALDYTTLDLKQIPALDLARGGSLATWLSSAMLATCAIFGLLTYQIRRYRLDDYRGRYRMWCWVVPMFLLASIDQVANVRESLRVVIMHVTGMSQHADAELIWAASVALLTGAVLGRLFIEMRACRLASLMLLISLACLAVLGATQIGWVLPDANILSTMILSALTMGAHSALLIAMFLYARHVHRDASGQVKPRRTRRRKRAERAPAKRNAVDRTTSPEPRPSTVRPDSQRRVRVDAAHTSMGVDRSASSHANSAGSSTSSEAAKRREQRRVAAETSTGRARSGSSSFDLEDDQGEPTRKLSKTERKRLRKQRRQERQT